jgi:hypothetical protein
LKSHSQEWNFGESRTSGARIPREGKKNRTASGTNQRPYCEEHFAPCYATGIAACMGAAPAGGVVGAMAGSWRGGGKLARWRGAAWVLMCFYNYFAAHGAIVP